MEEIQKENIRAGRRANSVTEIKAMEEEENLILKIEKKTAEVLGRSGGRQKTKVGQRERERRIGKKLDQEDRRKYRGKKQQHKGTHNLGVTQSVSTLRCAIRSFTCLFFVRSVCNDATKNLPRAL